MLTMPERPTPSPPLLATDAQVWRCSGCPAMLGLIEGQTVTIVQRARGDRYKRKIVATLPASQVCGECGTLNVRTNEGVGSPAS